MKPGTKVITKLGERGVVVGNFIGWDDSEIEDCLFYEVRMNGQIREFAHYELEYEQGGAPRPCGEDFRTVNPA